MRYVVQVADRNTGAEHALLLEAPSADDARAQAANAGWLVAGVEPLAPTADPRPAELAHTLAELQAVRALLAAMLRKWPSRDVIRLAVTWGVVIATLFVFLIGTLVAVGLAAVMHALNLQSRLP